MAALPTDGALFRQLKTGEYSWLLTHLAAQDPESFHLVSRSAMLAAACPTIPDNRTRFGSIVEACCTAMQWSGLETDADMSRHSTLYFTRVPSYVSHDWFGNGRYACSLVYQYDEDVLAIVRGGMTGCTMLDVLGSLPSIWNTRRGSLWRMLPNLIELQLLTITARDIETLSTLPSLRRVVVHEMSWAAPLQPPATSPPFTLIYMTGVRGLIHSKYERAIVVVNDMLSLSGAPNTDWLHARATPVPCYFRQLRVHVVRLQLEYLQHARPVMRFAADEIMTVQVSELMVLLHIDQILTWLNRRQVRIEVDGLLLDRVDQEMIVQAACTHNIIQIDVTMATEHIINTWILPLQRALPEVQITCTLDDGDSDTDSDTDSD